jgi:hypothetical protein
MKIPFLLLVISGLAAGAPVNHLNFNLPSQSAPVSSQFGDKGRVTITYDKLRMVPLGCDGHVVLSFMRVKTVFRDGTGKILLRPDAELGEPDSMDTVDVSFKVPADAVTVAVWFEGKNRFDSDDPPDCRDGDEVSPYVVRLN